MIQGYGRFYAGGTRPGERPEPDCLTCALRDGCARAEDGKFCPSWRSREPEDRGDGPADGWSRGEEI